MENQSELINELQIINSCRPQSCEKICELFLDHFEAHSSCLGGLTIFYKLIFFSEELIPFMRIQSEYYCQIIELYEKNINIIVKDAEQDERLFALNRLYTQNPLQNNSNEQVDFHTQLSKYIANNYPQIYSQTGQQTPNSAVTNNNNTQHYSNLTLVNNNSNNNNNSERGNHSQHYSTPATAQIQNSQIFQQQQQQQQQQQFVLSNSSQIGSQPIYSLSPSRKDRISEFEYKNNNFLQASRVSQGDISNQNYNRTHTNDTLIQNVFNQSQQSVNLQGGSNNGIQNNTNNNYPQVNSGLIANGGASPVILNTRNPSKRHSNNSNFNEHTLTEQNDKNINNNKNSYGNSSVPSSNTFNQNSSEQNSFMFNSKSSKAPKIPPLNLPQTNSENIGTLTRSTRRADPFKSFSTNSNRFSNSIDSGFKDQANQFGQRQMLVMPKSINENNFSIMDNDNSYFFDDRDEKQLKNISPLLKMAEIAQNLGEYNLTIDLGCLLAQRRKFQLDQVAKIACFQDVDSLIDLKIDESLIKQKIKKRKRDKGSSKKAEFKQQQQQQIEQEQITLLDSIDLKELNVVVGQDNLSSNTHREYSTQLSNMMGMNGMNINMMGQYINQNGNVYSLPQQQQQQMMMAMMINNRKKKSKTELNNIRKMLKIMSNIIFMVLKDLSDTEKQFLPSPVNSLYAYLSSETNAFNRKKDLIKFMCSRKGWNEFSEIEFETQKLNLICDGFETFGSSENKQYERMMQDLYKKKFQPKTNNNIYDTNSQLQNQYQGIISEKYPYMNNMVQNNGQQSNNNNINTEQEYNSCQSEQNNNDTTKIDNWNENFSLSEIEITLDQISLPENLIYFKVLDFFSIHSEKIHQLFSLRKGIFNQSSESMKENKFQNNEGSNQFYESQYNQTNSKSQNLILSGINIFSMNPSSDLMQQPYVISKGVQIPITSHSAEDIRLKTNEFLYKFEKKFRWYINNLDMNSSVYYDIEKEQLEILDGYLANCSSRIICFEVLESIIECLLMIKRQFVELSIMPSQISSRQAGGGASGGGTNSVRITNLIQNPTLNQRPLFSQSNSASKPKQNQKILSNTINSNTLNPSMMKQGMSGNRLIIDSPTKEDFLSSQLGLQQQASLQGSSSKIQSFYNTGQGSFLPGNLLPQQSQICFVMKHKEIFGNYLSIISRMMIKAPRNEMYKLLNQVYFKNENWKELIKIYSSGIFNDIINFCQEIIPQKKENANTQENSNSNINKSQNINQGNQKTQSSSQNQNNNNPPQSNFNHLQSDHINLFICAQKLLLYFKSSLIMCQNMIFRERLNEKKTEKSKEWKSVIRSLFQEMMFLIRPPNGLFYKYLIINQDINSVILQNKAKTKLPMSTVLQINLYKQILEFLGQAFGFCSNYSCFLIEDISSFYLKFCFTNFVKLYSHSNLNELNEISNKIRQVQNKASTKQELQENINNILNKTPKETSVYNPHSKSDINGNNNQQQPQAGQDDPNSASANNLQKYYHYFKIDLLKLYIKVLFSLSTTRTDDITRKFFQYRIVEFLTREIDLEFEITQIRERFIRVRNETKQNYQMQQLQQQQQQQQQQQSSSQNPQKQQNVSQHNRPSPQNSSQRSLPKSNQSFNNNPQSNSIKVNNKIQMKALNLESVNSNDHSYQQKQLSNEIQSITKSLNQLDYAQNSSEKQKILNQKKSNITKFSLEQNIGESCGRKTPNSNDVQQPQLMHQMKFQIPLPQKSISGEQKQQTYTVPNQGISYLPSGNNFQADDFQFDEGNQIQDKEGLGSNRYNNNNINNDIQNQEQVDNLNLSSTSSDGILFIPVNKSSMKMNIPQLKIPNQQNAQNMSQNQFDNVNNVDQNQLLQQDQSPSIQQGMGLLGNKPLINPMNKLSMKLNFANVTQKGNDSRKQNFNQNIENNYVQQDSSPQIPQVKSKNQSQRDKTENGNDNIQIEDYDYQKSNRSSSSEGNYQIPLTENTSNPISKMNLPALNLQQLIGGTSNQYENNKSQDQQLKLSKKDSNDNQIQPFLSTQKSNKPSLSLNLGLLSKGGESSQKSGEVIYSNQMKSQENTQGSGFQSNMNSKNSNNNNNNLNSNSNTYQNEHLKDLLNENIFYYQERKMRKVYADDELHAYVVSLIISLLLTPVRGTLDELYFSQIPINDGKQNILYLLHFHLNHSSNQSILPFLLQQICHIKPFPAGQRILKLLCAALNDFSMYTDLQYISAGQFGHIFEAKTNLPDPKVVAIKQMDISKSIQDSCVLHDIFNEITCLENFRFDSGITDIYDYGLSGNDYKIIMKRYPMSLKKWRTMQKKESYNENLPTYLTIYKDILKAIQLLHTNSVIHYDIKADNILLDYLPSGDSLAPQDQQMKVVLGDFGTCKLFKNEEDEYCLESKGTANIQSPEMITLALYNNKQGDRYDRRKKVGTTRSSDIWSLGCLLYEIMTGEFLFGDNNLAKFINKDSSNTEQILTQDNLDKIQNGIYAEFLRYILVKDQQIRPNIDNVIKRFEHIHALVVNSSTPISIYSPNLINPHQPPIPQDWSFETIITNYLSTILFPSEAIIASPSLNAKIKQNLVIKHSPSLIKIMEEIYLCSSDYFIEHQDRLMQSGITHVISDYSLFNELDLSRFTYLLLDPSQTHNKMSAVFRLSPKVMDYLREIFLFRGKVLFIEDSEVNISSPLEKLFIRNILIFCLTYFFKCSAYETLTLINSQVLFLQLPYYCLNQIIYSSAHLFKIENYLDTYPKAQCICGCTTFVLKRNFNQQKKMPYKLCNCSKENKLNDTANCPSDGCSEYLRFIRKRYKLNWDALKWVVLQQSNFLIGPFDSGQINDDSQIQIILNSEGPTKNSTLYQSPDCSKEKRDFGNKKQQEQEWSTYKCKVCHMWMFAMNRNNQSIAFIMNNMIRRNRSGITLPTISNNQKIKTPILRHFNLYELK